MKNNNVFEIALYHIKEDQKESFNNLSKRIISGSLSTLPGYICSQAFQSLDDSTLYLDVLEWKTLETAKAAVEIFEKDQQFKSFNDAISKISHFCHARMLENGSIMAREIRLQDQLELVIYTIKEHMRQKYEKSRPPLFSHLSRTYNQFRKVNTLHSLNEDHRDNNEDTMLDIVYWSDTSLCEKIKREMHKDAVFKPFAQTLGKVLHIAYFQRLR